jgi:TonB family protein
MKRCHACGEEFQDQFSYCPVDGKPLRLAQRVRAVREFQLTLISNEVLAQRLSHQLRFVVAQATQAWPSFKSDPIAYVTKRIALGRRLLKQTLARPHVLSGATAALLVLVAIVLSVLVLEKYAPKLRDADLADNREDGLRTVEIDLRTTTQSLDDSKGVGVGDKGRVGIGRGHGEGSGPVPATSAHGGGSGGTHNSAPPSLGRPPVPSVIPAPISTTMARLPPDALTAAGIDIDPALSKNLALSSYGDPRSNSKQPSNGPGDDGGIGTGKGTGIGEGSGPGIGPGSRGNTGLGDRSPGCCGEGGSRGNNPNPDPNRVYRSPEVSERARVLTKPEPQYTEEARRNSITGTVVLQVVFSRTGEVTNIRALQTLGSGLTEKAIAAARQIRFVPARKNGQPVSMYMQLEYNFNLY